MMFPIGRALVAGWLALTLLGIGPGGPARGEAASGWPRAVYGGAAIAGTHGRPAQRIPSYSVAVPPGWTARQWPDTLAGYGQLSLWPPTGGVIDLVILPLRPHGPALTELIAHDAAFLSGGSRDRVTLPLGRATRLSGQAEQTSLSSTILYLARRGVVYRLFSTFSAGSSERADLARVVASLRVPAAPGERPGAPPPPSQSPGETCCHCPAWGVGWGTVLARLDGIPVYSNAGNIDNGCDTTYGISYQCVELAQRYFALRWGYPPIWAGVGGASDMREHHPAGIEFIPNGGSPGPREGDAILFYGGFFGHVAMVQQVDRQTGRIAIVEENWSPTGQATLSLYGDNTIGIRDSLGGSYVVAGWLHSTRNG